MIAKPESKADLMPPFHHIGDSGWDTALVEFLCAFGIPAATPCTPLQLAACTPRLGTSLPESVQLFLERIGPQSLDGLRIVKPTEIRTPDDWFVSSMSSTDRRLIEGLLRIAESADDVFTVDNRNGIIHRLSHDPLGIRQTHGSFDDLIRDACVQIFTGYYGWVDERIDEMVAELRTELFPDAV